MGSHIFVFLADFIRVIHVLFLDIGSATKK